MHATLVVFIAGAAVALELPPFSGGARALLRVLPPFLVGLGSFGGPTWQPEPPSWSASRACESIIFRNAGSQADVDGSIGSRAR